MTRWVSCLLQAQSWTARHPDETRRLFTSETGPPEEFLHFAYSPRLASQVDVSLSPNRVALLRAKYDHLLQLGLLREAFDFVAFLDAGPLTQALQRQAA